MQHRIARTMGAVALATAGLMVPIAAGTAGAQDTLTFSVGTTQDIDTLNVTAGFLVIDYEIWNLTLPTLTNKAAADFSIEPALAESWTSSDDGLTWTYTLREGLQWSDGEPLTADDIVYTITRSVEEEWQNHISTTGNLTATAPDERTVVVTSAVPDPKLPILDMYIVPKHVYETISAEDLPNYPADDNISGGPFRIVERREGEFVRLEKNPNWYGDEPAMDELIFRIFENPEAQYNALRAGDLDAVDEVPTQIFPSLVDGAEENITAIGGNQGGFSELAMNAGCEAGIGDGHVALKDQKVRQAINWAIDRDLLVDKVLNGLGTPGVSISPSANPAFDLQVSDDERYTYDPQRAAALLDEAGWTDADGNGVREKDGVDLRLRFFDRSVGDASATTEFLTGWLNDVGIATEVQTYDEDTLTAIIGKGEFDLFTWGWVPFVDPDPMLSYLTSEQVTTDPEIVGYNDANWCNPEYDALYEQQKVELDAAKRADLIQQALMVLYTDAPYAVMYKTDDLQAFRSDRWENFVRQPAETGPVLFTNTSPAYLSLTPTDGAGGGDGSNLGLIIGAVAVVAVLGGGGLWLRGRRTKRDDDRE
ncbi:MAG: ABC transporter substrate-binding protein [Acidimicrobiia bacterium]